MFSSRHDSELFVRCVLSDEAFPSKCGGGIYTAPYGNFRVSDRTARIALSVQALIMVGLSCDAACVFVTDLLKEELGQSRRGRPSLRSRRQSFAGKVQTVRSLWNFHRKSQFRSTLPLVLWVDQFRRWKQWAFFADDDDLDFLGRIIRSKRGSVSAKKFRDAIDLCRSMLPRPKPGDWSWPLYVRMKYGYRQPEEEAGAG